MTTFALIFGKTTMLHVVPDSEWPGMWRIKWPDGSISDMVNLPRAKEAAKTLCAAKLSLKSLTGFRWSKHASLKVAETCFEAPYRRSFEEAGT